MMRGFVNWSQRFRSLVIIVAAAIMIAGVIQMRKMPVDVLPEFSPPYVEIQTESLGLSAKEVEELITVPMEQDILNGVPWVDTITSDSVPGLSSIRIVFKPGTNLLQARQMVSERMTQAVALPHVSKPPIMLQPLSSTSRVMIVGLSSKTLSMIQMGVLARWTIAPRLLGVPGVANVAIWGQRDRQLQVLVDPKRLEQNKLALLDVLETTGNALWVSSLSFVEASTPGTGGFIDTPNQRLGVYHISPIITADGLAQVPIGDKTNPNGTAVRLGDVANVVEDHQPLIGDAVVNNSQGLLLVIQKFPGSNTLEVTKSLEEALAQMQPGLPNLIIDTSLYRPASFIESGIQDIGLALLLGGLLMLLVFIIMYWDWRTTLISGLVITLSLAAAGLVLSLLGTTINAMVLTGMLIALTIVIDDTIIDVENILRRLRQQRQAGSDRPAVSIVFEASGEMRSAVFSAALITLLAVVPVFFIQGVSGDFFRPLAVSYAVAVLASIAVAVFFTPALCMVLLPRNPGMRRESPVLVWFRGGYQAILARLFNRPRLSWIALSVLLVIGLACLPFVKPSLLPNFKERDLIISLNSAPGTSQPEMSRMAGRVAAELRTIPGVREVAALVGRAVLGDQVVNINSTQLAVSIDPAADYDKSVAAVRDVVNGYPGLRPHVQTYLKQADSSVIAQSKNSISVRVYGDTDEILLSTAKDIQKAITGIRGITATHIQQPIQQLTLETEVNIDAAQRHGLAPGDVRRAAVAAFAGIQVGSIFEEQKVFDVVVWSTPETRHSVNSVSTMTIDAPDGTQVRLGDVAKVQIAPTDADIRHEAVKRYMDITVNVSGRGLKAVAVDIQNRMSQMQFPLEYHAAVLGDYASAQAARNRMLGILLVTLVGIFFMLQAAFGSWLLAGVFLLALPAALAGGMLAVLTGGSILSIGSLAGFLAAFAIASRNGMLIINHYQHLQRFEGEEFGPTLALRGASERMAPVFMTTLAVIFAFLPALFLGDIPGLEVMRPMAAVLVGGMITALLVNLFILPVLYLSLGIRPEPEMDLEGIQPMPSTPLKAPELGTGD